MSEIASASPISINEFSRICRTCFGVENLLPLFELVVDSISGTDLLEHSVNLQVNRGDNLPENVCETCVVELHKIYKFKRQCGENDAVLKLVMNENSEYNREIKAVDLIKIENEEVDTKPVIQEPRYNCKDCLLSFEMHSEYRLHNRNVHYGKRTHLCKLCNKVFTNSKFKQHMRTHMKEPYQCKVCSRSFNAVSSLIRHRLVHTGERPHKCSQCGKKFTRLSYRVAHEKSHQRKTNPPKASSFNCEQCGRKFKYLAHFNAHLKTHSSPEKCKFPMPDSTRQHICEICGRGYKKRSHLEAHLLIHGEKKFVCVECGKGFCKKTSLQAHMRMHTGERPYKCDLCEKSYGHSSGLAAHMLSHSGYRPFKCNQCAKAFIKQAGLIRHLRTHSGEKPYVCEYCGKGFALKENLKVHVRTHTGETPFVCEICKKGFHDYTSHKRHVMRNHAKVKIEPDQTLDKDNS